ncbi:MAG: two-component system histidine kinase PnpS [Bacillota bacterium]
MMQKLRSIKMKVVILYLLLLVITLLVAGFFLQDALKGYFSKWIDKQLIGEMNLLAKITKPLVEEKSTDKLDDLLKEYGEELGARITIVNPKGVVLADSRETPAKMDNHLQRPEIQQSLQEGLGKKTRYSKTLNLDMKYIAAPIKEGQNVIGIIRIALDLTTVNKIYQGIWEVLFEVGIAVIFISIILSWKFASNITDPIEDMTDIAEKISKGSLDQKMQVKSKDEIGLLARMFNRMVDKIKGKMDQISNEKSKIEAIVTSIGDGVIAVGLNKKIMLMNLAARDIFDVEEEVLHEPVLKITKNHKLDELIDRALTDLEQITEEITLLLPNERNFRVRLAPIIRNDKATGIVVSLRDITDMKQLQNMRTEFVSNVSHELKTPLTSIKGYVETLLEIDPDGKTYQSFLKVIKDETNRLEVLIEDILDLSKIESKVSQEQKEVDLKQVINNVLSLVEPKANDKEVDLKLQLGEELPVVKGDYNQLSRMMINLIDNAIKYTPQGGFVKLKSKVKQEQLIIEVEDNGLGIPKEDLSRIFERFYRVDKGRSRKLGGTGLGLSIVKHIIENHGGEIEVESKLEQGTKFIIKLPVV